MKRYWFLAFLLLVLPACSVSIEPLPTAKVSISPTNPAVAPGGKVDLKATLDNGSSAQYTWEVPVGSSFETLAPDTIRLTAPTTSGTYAVKATATNVNSTPGETQVIVDVLLSGEIKNATIDPANAEPPAIVTASIAAGATGYWTINVPADVAASGKALYIDVVPGSPSPSPQLQLTVFTSDRRAFASSYSPTFFAQGEITPPVAQGLVPAGIITNPNICLGSCVIQASRADTFYVKITNLQNAPVQYQFYAFVSSFGDAGEDANDASANAISLTTVDVGAIEEIGDIDYYRVDTAGRTLRFNTTVTDLGLQAVVTRAGAQLATLTNGQTTAVQVGDIIEVKSMNNRAADSSRRYNVELF